MNACDTITPETVHTTNQTIIHLPLGLLGFESVKKYLLISQAEDAPFHWVQMLEDARLAFLVLSPFEVLPDYEMDLSDEDAEFLKIRSPGDVLAYTIVKARPDGTATINLKGPIVLNRFALIGKQVVLRNAARFSINHPLPTAA